MLLLAGVDGDGNPMSTSTFSSPFPSSCELEISGPSLLGTGVIFWAMVFFRPAFLIRPFGVDFWSPLLAATPLAFGVPFVVAELVVLAAFEKNPRIVDWFLLDEALELCFFKAGGGRAGVEVGWFVFAMI
jgi:hypothetical protein